MILCEKKYMINYPKFFDFFFLLPFPFAILISHTQLARIQSLNNLPSFVVLINRTLRIKVSSKNVRY